MSAPSLEAHLRKVAAQAVYLLMVLTEMVSWTKWLKVLCFQALKTTMAPRDKVLLSGKFNALHIDEGE
jgi:hypothetical protein